jgi:hypothetical protein
MIDWPVVQCEIGHQAEPKKMRPTSHSCNLQAPRKIMNMSVYLLARWPCPVYLQSNIQLGKLAMYTVYHFCNFAHPKKMSLLHISS